MSRSSTLKHLLLAAASLASVAGCDSRTPMLSVPGGDAGRGEFLVQRYGCVACHTVPGIASVGANVGPPLTHIAERGYLAGLLPHTVENMILWLRDPPAVDADTAMPDLGISEAEARDIAAFLYAGG